jgi:hypothetical protein
MIKIDMTSSDVDRQMEVLQHFPDLAEKHYRPTIRRDVSALASTIKGQIPVRTGTALNTFGSKVSGKGFGIRGQVGWYDSNDPWYINVVEHGAKPHVIRSQEQGGFLFFGGTFAQEVHHPGFSARGFMAAGASAMQAAIENDLAMANERIIADLAAI